jgi:hypothetical protein
MVIRIGMARDGGAEAGCGVQILPSLHLRYGFELHYFFLYVFVPLIINLSL